MINKGLSKVVVCFGTHSAKKSYAEKKAMEPCRDELEVKLHAKSEELEKKLKRLQEMLADIPTMECLRRFKKKSSVRIENQRKL